MSGPSVLDFKKTVENEEFDKLTLSKVGVWNSVEVSVELVKPKDQFYVIRPGGSYGPFEMILRAGSFVVFRDLTTRRVFRSTVKDINDRNVFVALTKHVDARAKLPPGYVERPAQDATIGTVFYLGGGPRSPFVLGPCTVRDRFPDSRDKDKLLFSCGGIWYRAAISLLNEFRMYMKPTRFTSPESAAAEIARCVRVIVLNFDQTILDFDTKVVPYRNGRDVDRFGGVDPHVFASASVLMMLCIGTHIPIYVATFGFDSVVKPFMEFYRQDFPDDHILTSGGVELANKNDFLDVVARREHVTDKSDIWLIDCSVSNVNAARIAGFSAFHCPAETGMTDYQWELFAEQVACEPTSGVVGVGAGSEALGESSGAAVMLPPMASRPVLRTGTSGLGGILSRARSGTKSKSKSKSKPKSKPKTKTNTKSKPKTKTKSKSKSKPKSKPKRRPALQLRRQPCVRGSR